MVNADWKKLNFLDLCSVNIGLTHTPTYIEHGIPFLSVKDLNNGILDFSNAKQISEEEYLSISNAAKPQKGDIVFGRVGTLGNPCIVNTDTDFAIFVSLGYLRTKDTVLNTYIYHWLRSDFFSRLVEEKIAGSSQKNLNTGWLKEFDILLPPLAEQEIIAGALSDMDGMITALERLIAKKKAVKRGTVQELLTGKKRLCGFAEEWISVKLKDIFEIRKGGGLSKEKLSPDGEYECILYGELFTKYSEVINNIVSKTDFSEGLPSCKYDVLMPGSTTTNGLDLATASTILKDGVLLGGDIVVLRPKRKVDTRIFGYLFPMKAKEILQHTQGITIVHLNTGSFGNMEVKIPKTFEEQSAIASVLYDMDNEIETLEQKLAKTRRLKEGMMQQLLTGKIRLV